jgi:hypothetical protein
MTVVYADVYYYDDVNGNNTFKQKFYLKGYGTDWRIVDMKLATGSSNSNSNTTVNTEASPQYGMYSYETSSGYGEFEVVGIDGVDLYYTIYISTADGYTGEIEDGYAMYENGKWTDDYDFDGSCIINLSFVGNYVKISTSGCSEYVGGGLSFNGTYYKE